MSQIASSRLLFFAEYLSLPAPSKALSIHELHDWAVMGQDVGQASLHLPRHGSPAF